MYDNTKLFKLSNFICNNELDSMENDIEFSFTLLDLELAEIRDVKVGGLITPCLSNLLYRVQYYETYKMFNNSTYYRTFLFKPTPRT